MFFVIVLLLGHSEYKVREVATIICNHPYFEFYLQAVYLQSECAETRQRASAILSKWDRIRTKKLYQENYYAYYLKWMKNGCNCRWICEETIVKDIQLCRKRQAIIYMLSNQIGIDDPGSWCRGTYSPWGDHPCLDRFRKTLQHKEFP